MQEFKSKKGFDSVQLRRLQLAVEQGKYDVHETKYFLEEVLRVIEVHEVDSSTLSDLFGAWLRALDQPARKTKSRELQLLST
jgi:hypothetical protein